MARNFLVVILILVIFFGGFSSVSASTPPAKIVTGILSNVVSALVKRLWSLKSSAKTAVSSGSKIKYEGGYTVETVFDGSKLGIEPYSVDISPSGEILVLDSENSNIYRVSTPLSKYSRPKLVAGSSEGYHGHIDGRPREARMNHPKGLTVDDRGNIYVADTMNMAIRKISDSGVTTIAGGKWGQGGGHVDGPSEDAKFSDEFDLVYVGSSCSLLVIDRGNQAIREIQLQYEDCSEHSDGNLYIDIAGISVLVAAVFFGYMLALLHNRVRAMFSSNDANNQIQQDSRTLMKRGPPVPPYQRPPRSVRPPLIPPEDDMAKPEDGFFGSIGKLVANTGSSVVEIFGGLFTRKKPVPYAYQFHPQYQQRSIHTWPMQESFVIPDDDEPPPLETRVPTPKRANPYMSKDLEKKQNIKQSRAYYSNGWDGDYQRQQQQHMMQNHQQHIMQSHHLQQQQHHHRQFSANPQTYYEKSCETNEIVFGAVQEQDGRREAVVIKAVDYGDPAYSHHNIRPRLNYMSYSHGY